MNGEADRSERERPAAGDKGDALAAEAWVTWLKPRVGPVAVALGTLLLAYVTTQKVLATTGGEPAVPLDDAYIHFQFARSFAELRPLHYAPGSPAVAGATSLLWPALLAPFWACGLTGSRLVWAAWGMSWVALGLLAFDTKKLAERLTSETSAIAAGAMVLAFGGYAWGAGSGMEVVPFAWLLVRSARRATEWYEASSGDASARPRLAELLVLSWATPLMRPEGVIASVLIAGALALSAKTQAASATRGSGLRLWAPVAVALVGPLLTPAVYWLLTGSASSTTAAVKWLPTSPYRYGGRIQTQILENLKLLYGTLLDGEIWSAIFLPSGSGPVAWLACPSLILAGSRTKKHFRAAAALAVALGMLLPTTYDSFLWNRLRYLWPFAAGWFIGVAALADLAGEALADLNKELRILSAVLAGAAVGALAGHLPYALRDVASSADAIRRQQVALGAWAAKSLPDNALIGVNDTGAIAYFSGRKTFDVVGLTTRGEARYWVAGAGSRFEHYERLASSERPTHFIVYEQWFALPDLLGEYLTERSVPGATILGGETMVAHVADFRALGSGAEPAAPPAGRRLDEVDVADLESEQSHGYALYWAQQTGDIVIKSDDERADGARSGRTLDFMRVEAAPGAVLVARLGATEPIKLAVRLGDRDVGELPLDGEAWQELTLVLPADAPGGRQPLELRPPPHKTFTAAHYWLYAAR